LAVGKRRGFHACHAVDRGDRVNAYPIHHSPIHRCRQIHAGPHIERAIDMIAASLTWR
jgi:hypothetical protein